MKQLIFIVYLALSAQIYCMNTHEELQEEYKLIRNIGTFLRTVTFKNTLYLSIKSETSENLHQLDILHTDTQINKTLIEKPKAYFIKTPSGEMIPMNFIEDNPLDIDAEYLAMHPRIIYCESLWTTMVAYFYDKIYFIKGPAYGQLWSEYYATIKMDNDNVWQRFFWIDYPNLINTFQKPEGLTWKQVYLELKDALHWMEKVRESFGPRYIDCGPPQGRTWREYYHDIESSQQGLSPPNRIEL